MNIKNEVLVRAYIVLAIMVVFAVVVFTKAAKITIVEGEHWRAMGDSLYVDLRPVDAQRGSILTQDGSLLATSLPFFEIRMDLTTAKDAVFEENVDSLALMLATFVNPNYTVGGMSMLLRSERLKGNRYFLIQKKATLEDVERIRQFPILDLGRYRGGVRVIQRSERKRPFGILAHRTIGYIREGALPVGLEGAFDKTLSGKEGKQVMVKVGKNTWMPVDDLTEIEPEDGKDLVTTVDIDLQDIVENALMRGVRYHAAKSGTAIVMEVKTGAVKAIANLGKSEEGYWERYNYGIGSATEPGSTFKAASMLAMLEDGYINLEDTINLHQGKYNFYEEELIDASPHGLDTTTIRHAFEISSNVGIAKLVQRHYGKDRKGSRFIKRLKSFGLNLPTGINIEGEADPYIKEAYSKDDHWSGTTLPWMSIGYELTITPLQLLNFYNTIANNGVKMKPYLVSEVQQYGQTVEEFKPTVITKKMASAESIAAIQSLLEGVVESGTARKLKSDKYSFAGKTGTAQLDYQRLKARTDVGGYQSSFAGYFPAKAPVYSVIVLVSNPTEHGYYGSTVAGPIVREIMDKMYASRPELQVPETSKAKPQLASKTLPKRIAGNTAEIQSLFEQFDLDFEQKQAGAWSVVGSDSDTLKVYRRKIVEKQVPNVTGMGLRDAIFILENLGLAVTVKGVGKVKRQSIKPGTKITGQRIKLSLG